MYYADVGSNNSGYYELKAVLTHKGRSSNSGHYVAWVKNEKKQGMHAYIYVYIYICVYMHVYKGVYA